jgi:hypothetical protein
MVTSMPCANDIVGVDGDVRVELRVLNASKAKLGTEKSSRGNTSQPLKGLRSQPHCVLEIMRDVCDTDESSRANTRGSCRAPSA